MDNFRKGKLDGKLMKGAVLLFFVLLILGVVNASAVECPPGFKWVRMSGIGCVQEDCLEIEHAKLSPTSECICIEGYKGCYEPPFDHSEFDRNKCGPHCPRVRLVACVKSGEPCPGEEPEKEEERIEEDGIDEASKGLKAAVDTIKKMKAEGATDKQIAEKVNQIVKNRIESINNPDRVGRWDAFWETLPIAIANNKDYAKWRNFDCGDYDTAAIWAWNNRVGYCEENAATVYYILRNAGIKCDYYRQRGQKGADHIFVIINMDKTGSLTDSRSWSKNTLVVDAWQGKVLTGTEAYKNKKIMSNGKYWVQKRSHLPVEGYENIRSRNLIWDSKKKQWRCRDGYVKKMEYAPDPKGEPKKYFAGFCVPKK